MKFVGATIFVVALILVAAYIGGVFEAKTEVTIQINQDVKKNIIECTTDLINDVKETTDNVFVNIQNKIADEAKEKNINE